MHFDLIWIYVCNRLQLIARFLQEVRRGCKRELISVDLSCTIRVLKNVYSRNAHKMCVQDLAAKLILC